MPNLASLPGLSTPERCAAPPPPVLTLSPRCLAGQLPAQWAMTAKRKHVQMCCNAISGPLDAIASWKLAPELQASRLFLLFLPCIFFLHAFLFFLLHAFFIALQPAGPAGSAGPGRS